MRSAPSSQARIPILDLELGPPEKKTKNAKKTKKQKNTTWNCKNIVFYKGIHSWNLKNQRKAETSVQNHILTKKNTNWNCKNIVFYKGFHSWNLKNQRKADTFLQNHILTKENTNWNCKNHVKHNESAFSICVFASKN